MKNYSARLSRLERELAGIGGLGPSWAEYAAAHDELREHVREKIMAVIEGHPIPPEPDHAIAIIRAYDKANHIPPPEGARERLAANLEILVARAATTG